MEAKQDKRYLEITSCEWCADNIEHEAIPDCPYFKISDIDWRAWFLKGGKKGTHKDCPLRRPEEAPALSLDEVEALSAEIHRLYCAEYEKQNGKPYWTHGDYDKLDEATKDYDRNIARWHITKYRGGDGEKEKIARNLSIIAARAFGEVEQGEVCGEYKCAIEVLGSAILHLEVLTGLAVIKPEESAEDFIKRTYGLWT